MLIIDPDSIHALDSRTSAGYLTGDKEGSHIDSLRLAKIYKQRGEEQVAKSILLRVHRSKPDITPREPLSFIK